MNIYKKDGSLLLSVPVTSNAKYVRELAGDCYILLSWYAPYGTPLDAGTYIEHNGVKYALLDTYTPRMNTEASWLYEPQFKPQEMAWSKIPFFFYNGDSRESDWTLTSDAPDFLECVIKAIKNETGEEYTFSTDVTGTITLQFSSTDILSGLNQIADGFKTEWWVKDKVIHLSRCIDDTKTEISLSIGENVGIPSVSEKSEGYYNRFYVFGSTRNIVQGYSGANVNNLTNKRLTLDPVKYPNGYYQLTDGTFSKVLIYEDIYPAATNIEIVSLMSKTDYVLDDNGKKIQIGTDSEGNPIWDMFTVWYMKIAYKNPDGTYTDFEFNDWNYTDDPNVHAGKEGMLIPGLKVSVNFASGPLMGREFELAYIKSDTTIKTSSGSIVVPKGYFEILYTKENDYIIPDSAYLVPVEGNNVVLFNIKMPDIYIQDAYDRLEAAMKKDIEEKYLSDLNQYTFETYPGAFGSIDIGAPVAFGTLKTRVVSVSYNLETPSVFEITIGNELQKGTIQQLVDDTLTANKNIEIIAALNKTTEAIANAYTRTYQEILKQFDLISSIFELDTTSVKGKTLIHAKYDGLYSDGDIAAGGAWAGTPSGGGKTYLNELLDVQLATSSLSEGDMLMWNGDKYVNIPQSSITPDLSEYATKQWVLDKKYLTSVPVASVVGLTGNITTAQVATALTDAGYKLTDTTYELATTTSNGLMSATDKTKLDGIAENANNYTLPTASSSTKGGIKVGTTLSISEEVLNLKSGFPNGTFTKVQTDSYGRVVSGSTLSASDIPNLSWSKITTGKPTTISGYGIEDAYTKTETDSKVAELQSLLDSMFERVYDSNNKLIRVHSNVTISSSGDLVAGSNSEGGGTSGGAYTQLEWNAIKALTQSESGLLASAYSVKEAYNELNTAIEILAGKATNVKFTQTLTSGKQIGSISIDGKSTSLFAPANYAWSEVSDRPTKLSQFTDDVVSGKYLPLSGGTMANTNVVTNLNADLLDGYHASYFASAASLGNYLPLTGGTLTGGTGVYTPLVIKNTNLSEIWIQFQDGTGTTHIGSANGVPSVYLGSGSNQTLIHSGNVGDYTLKDYGNQGSIDFNNVLYNGYQYTSGLSSNNGKSYGVLASFCLGDSSWQIVGGRYGGDLVYRSGNGTSTSWGEWKTIAFTDSDITGTAAKAKALVTNDGRSCIYASNDTFYIGDNIYPTLKTNILGNSIVLRYGASASDGLVLNSSGNVGIGTPNPVYKLDVAGTGRFTGAVTMTSTLTVEQSVASKGFFTSGDYGLWKATSFGSGYTDNDIVLYGSTIAIAGTVMPHGNSHSLGTSSKQWSHLYAVGATFSGNVGIGTTSPAYKLDVNGTLRATGAATIASTLNVSGATTLGGTLQIGSATLTWNDSALVFDKSTRFRSDTFLDNWAYLRTYLTDGTAHSLIGVNNSDLLLINDGTTIPTIIRGGNVGIGTTSPSYKLHIVGTAYATENIIAAGDLTAGSDIRYKDKIQDLRLSVHDIALAPAFTYKWNNREDDALVHIGSSAQYWLNTNAKDAVYYDKQNDFYHLNYASLALCNTIILARGMETQEEKIARLEERINELEDKLRQYDSCR